MNARAQTVAPQLPDVEDRIEQATRTVANNPEPSNEPLPDFFRALARQMPGTDHCGTSWNMALPALHTARLAAAHRKTAAVTAIAGLLMADEEISDGDGVARFTPHRREGLFLALTELTNDLHDLLSETGEALEGLARGRSE